MFPILPFLHEMRRRLTPARYHPKHPPATEIYNTGYTYVGMNFFVDGSKADEAPGFCLSAWYDPETKQAGGLMFHGDEANARFKHGAIAALGSCASKPFPQSMSSSHSSTAFLSKGAPCAV